MITQRTALLLVSFFACAAMACGDDEREPPTTNTGGEGGTGGASATGGGGGLAAGPCADSACLGMAPSAECTSCVASQCASELAACQGDSGNGGAPGCRTCADHVADSSIPTSDLCPSSAMLAGALDACVCGDGVGIAGKCS